MPERHTDAEARYRKQMWITLGIVAMIGAIGLFGLNQWLRHIEHSAAIDDPSAALDRLTWISRLIQLAIAGVLAALGYWLLRLASATRLQKRWPPRHVESSDMGDPVAGERALRIARTLSVIAWTAFAAGLIVFLRLLWRWVF